MHLTPTWDDTVCLLFLFLFPNAPSKSGAYFCLLIIPSGLEVRGFCRNVWILLSSTILSPLVPENSMSRNTVHLTKGNSIPNFAVFISNVVLDFLHWIGIASSAESVLLVSAIVSIFWSICSLKDNERRQLPTYLLIEPFIWCLILTPFCFLIKFETSYN